MSSFYFRTTGVETRRLEKRKVERRLRRLRRNRQQCNLVNKPSQVSECKQLNQRCLDTSSILKLNAEELKQQVQSLVAIPGLFFEILDHVQQPANQKYRELIETALRTVDQADGKDQRRIHEERRLKAQLIYDQICVFESGLFGLSGMHEGGI